MREIKFRAWDKKLKNWFSPTLDASGTAIVEERHEEGCGCGAVHYGTHPIEYPRQYELVQYTGLKDKNGKEIYEGDIITYESNTGERNAMVYWRQGSLGYQMRASLEDGKAGEIMDIPRTPDEREIIGNIYENPELLQDKQKEIEG